LADDWQHGGFGLYIHWPFCAAKCPYCDFNSHVSSRIDVERWQTAYLSELDRSGSETRDRVLNSVYFGGGTPSLMPPGLVGAILDKLSAYWQMANDLEVTLEANPSSVEAERFAGYRAAGVNRVSLGVQALNDPDLRALGRLHNVEQALQALDTARSTFDRISFDLIYARQHQALGDWQAELTRALSFEPDHVSLYQLTIEDGTAFGDRYQRGKLAGLPDEDLSADMYFSTQEICTAAGLPAYEISNHARPGEESRHNLIYWRGGDYLGIGPGAHGRITQGGVRYASETELSPAGWLDRVAQSGSGETVREPLSPTDHAGEYLMMSLRMSEGTDLVRLRALSENHVYDSKINVLEGVGLVETEGHHLRATHKGRPLLNQIITALLPD
jgi:putative oxygen-independent coproporphyrinogen III oxidase